MSNAMEERKELNYEEIINGMSKNTTVDDLTAKGVPADIADIMVKTFKQGEHEYYWKHYHLNEKHRDVCVKVCEKLL